jgi:hypothetical protein
METSLKRGATDMPQTSTGGVRHAKRDATQEAGAASAQAPDVQVCRRVDRRDSLYVQFNRNALVLKGSTARAFEAPQILCVQCADDSDPIAVARASDGDSRHGIITSQSLRQLVRLVLDREW